MVNYGLLTEYMQTLSWTRAWKRFLILCPFPWDEWQLDDFDVIMECIENPKQLEVLLLRSRRLGKTQTCVYLTVFGIVMGLSIVYFTNALDQLDQPAIYFSEKIFPFLNTKACMKFEKHTYDSEGLAYLRSLTENTARSKTIDWVIFDEEGSMIGKELFIKAARKMIANSKFPLIIHVGSARAGSPYHDNYTRMITDCPEYVLEHPWQEAKDSDWFNEAIVMMDKRQAIIDGTMWEWEQEYECKWTVPHGLIFKHLIQEDWSQGAPYLADRFGIDINLTEACAGIYLNEEHTECWVLTEDEFDWASDQRELEWLRGRKFEVEDGGYNQKEAIMLNRLYGGTRSLWKTPQKQERLFLARRMIIHIDPKRTPRLFKDLFMAEYNYLGIYLKDSKHPI